MGLFAVPPLRVVMYAATAGAVVVSGATVLDRGLDRVSSGAYLATYAALLALGAFVPRGRIFVDARVETAHDELALTLEGGPHPVHTPAAMGALEAHNARGTFFVHGALVEAYPEVARSIRDRGHTLGSLGYALPDRFDLLRPLSWHLRDAERDSEVWSEVLGKPPRWMRPSNGAFTPRVSRVCDEYELDAVAWTAYPQAKHEENSTQFAERAVRSVWPGALVRMRGAPMLRRRDAREAFASAPEPREISALGAMAQAAARQNLRVRGLDEALDAPGAPPAVART